MASHRSLCSPGYYTSSDRRTYKHHQNILEGCRSTPLFFNSSCWFVGNPSIPVMLLFRALLTAALAGLLSVVDARSGNRKLYVPKHVLARESGPRQLEEIRPNGVNMDRSFGPLPTERAPNSPMWNNSLALCTSIKWEMPEDILEWVQYYKCAPSTSRPQSPRCASTCALLRTTAVSSSQE